MKKINLLPVILACTLFLGGCETLDIISAKDKGGPLEMTETFNKSYDDVWRAASQALVGKNIESPYNKSAGPSNFSIAMMEKGSGIIQTHWANYTDKKYTSFATCSVLEGPFRMKAEIFINKKDAQTTTLRLKTDFEAFSNATNSWYKCQSEKTLEYSLLADIKRSL